MSAQESFCNAEATTKPAVAEAATSCECSGSRKLGLCFTSLGFRPDENTSFFLLSYVCVCVWLLLSRNIRKRLWKLTVEALGRFWWNNRKPAKEKGEVLMAVNWEPAVASCGLWLFQDLFHREAFFFFLCFVQELWQSWQTLCVHVLVWVSFHGNIAEFAVHIFLKPSKSRQRSVLQESNCNFPHFAISSRVCFQLIPLSQAHFPIKDCWF